MSKMSISRALRAHFALGVGAEPQQLLVGGGGDQAPIGSASEAFSSPTRAPPVLLEARYRAPERISMLQPFETCCFFNTKMKWEPTIYKLQCSGVVMHPDPCSTRHFGVGSLAPHQEIPIAYLVHLGPSSVLLSGCYSISLATAGTLRKQKREKKHRNRGSSAPRFGGSFAMRSEQVRGPLRLVQLRT